MAYACIRQRIYGNNEMKNLTVFLIMALFCNFLACAQGSGNTSNGGTMKIIVGDRELTATLVQNSSTEALLEWLREGPITINMRDYGNMEKVGSLGRNLPRNDERINAVAGDIILYQGNSLVIYYAPNTWSFTRLGRVNNVTGQELLNILGAGNVTVILEATE